MKLLSKFCIPLALALTSLSSLAQSYPDQPIRLVVPFPPGGTTDLLARIFATEMSKGLGQQVIVDNRPGAGGSVGAALVARAPADGYMLLFGTLGTQAINPALYKKLSYDPTKDFSPIALFADVPNILVVNPELPVTNVQELIAYSKANPGALNMGSSGNGSSNHLSGELFKSMTGAEFTHIPYKGGAQVTTDLIGGRIELNFDNLPGALPHIKGGRIKPLAVTSAERSTALPNIPTIAESGVKGYEAGVWFGVLGPAGMPAAVVDRLAKEMDKISRDKAMIEKIDQVGGTLATSSPSIFAQRIREDMGKWANVVKESGAIVD